MSEGQRKARAEQRWMMCFALLMLFFGWLLDDIEKGVAMAWPLVVGANIIKVMRLLHEDARP